MKRNTRKVFHQAHKDRALELLSYGREATNIICTHTKPFGPEYKLALNVSESIDDLAEALTGSREFLRQTRWVFLF